MTRSFFFCSKYDEQEYQKADSFVSQKFVEQTFVRNLTEAFLL